MSATQTINLLNPTHTQSSLVDAIKTAFSSLGYDKTFVELTQGNNKFLVYTIPLNNGSTYTDVYLQVKVTTTNAVSQRLFAAWDTSKNIGINGGQESTAVTFANNAVLEVRTFDNLSEIKFIALSQVNKYALLGYLRPSLKHPAFNENLAPYIFQSNNIWNQPFLTWNSTLLSPYTSANYTSNMGSINLSKIHPITGKRDLLAGMLLFSSTGQGIAGKTSEDIVSVASLGLNKFDSIQDSENGYEYILLYPGNGSMAIMVNDATLQ